MRGPLQHDCKAEPPHCKGSLAVRGHPSLAVRDAPSLAFRAREKHVRGRAVPCSLRAAFPIVLLSR